MELRLLQMALRVLDPRRWKARLAQLGILLGGVTWVWVRAVQSSDALRARRDAERRTRRERIHAAARELERARREWAAAAAASRQSSE